MPKSRSPSPKSPQVKKSDVVREKELGKGSYGKVWLGKYKEDVVAVKEIAVRSKSRRDHKAQVESALKEAAILEGLTHENIVRFLGYYEDVNLIVLLMEFCGLGGLDQFAANCYDKGDLIEERHVQYVLKGISSGMAFMHAQKVIHSDIKTANVLIDNRGIVKIADLGLAKLLEANDDKRSTLCGTPEYMAPEIMSADYHHLNYDNKVDIWALGAIAIELASGYPPFYQNQIARCRTPNDLQRYWHDIEKAGVIPKLYVSDEKKFSSKFHQFLDQCLQPLPLNRPAAAELLTGPFLKEDPSINAREFALFVRKVSGKAADDGSLLIPRDVPSIEEDEPKVGTEVTPAEADAEAPVASSSSQAAPPPAEDDNGFGAMTSNFLKRALSAVTSALPLMGIAPTNDPSGQAALEKDEEGAARPHPTLNDSGYFSAKATGATEASSSTNDPAAAGAIGAVPKKRDTAIINSVLNQYANEQPPIAEEADASVSTTAATAENTATAASDVPRKIKRNGFGLGFIRQSMAVVMRQVADVLDSSNNNHGQDTASNSENTVHTPSPIASPLPSPSPSPTETSRGSSPDRVITSPMSQGTTTTISSNEETVRKKRLSRAEMEPIPHFNVVAVMPSSSDGSPHVVSITSDPVPSHAVREAALPDRSSETTTPVPSVTTQHSHKQAIIIKSTEAVRKSKE